MDLVITFLGLALVAIAVYDIFRTLFLPSGKGLISRWIAYVSWSAVRKGASWNGALLGFAGPLAFANTAGTWAFLLIVGWAFVYWPWMPAAFSYSPGLVPENNAGFLDALYLSLVTLATLGYGDITPSDDWIRLLSPLQALLGFGLVTAIISWLLSIYPNLSRRQVFALEVSLLRNAERESGSTLVDLNATDTARFLAKLASSVVTIRGDIEQFPITYYFHSNEEQSALSVALPYVLELTASGSQSDCPVEVRLESIRLRRALDDLGQTLASRFLDVSSSDPTERIYEAYARDHFHTG